MPKYAVLNNMPGYLSDSDPLECESLEEAKDILKCDIKRAWEESNAPEIDLEEALGHAEQFQYCYFQGRYYGIVET